MFDTGDEEDLALQREYGLIESACARARKQYLDSGTFTHLADDPQYVEFQTFGYAGRPTQHPLQTDSNEDPRYENTGSIDDNGRTGESPELSPFAGLKHSLDPNGREIYIEREDARGKPVVWYICRKDGRFTHTIAVPNGGNHGLTVDGPVCRLGSG